MFFDDKHKAITTIMAKRGPKGGQKIMGPAMMKSEEVMDEGGEVDPRHLAAQDILAAHQDGSALKLMDALANFMDLHHARHELAEDEE